MALLKVIGAGLCRTGTMSLRDALNILGYNTHHGIDFALNPVPGINIFSDCFYHPDKQPLDWDVLYEGFDAAVDVPTALFAGTLMEQYPDAKVILVERDFDKWYSSVRETVYWGFCLEPEGVDEELLEFFKSEAYLDGIFNDKESFLDKERVRSIYEKHNKWIKENVPANRLLLMKMVEGWDRLCAFLGKQVPDVPFPHVNSAKEFRDFFHYDKHPAENIPIFSS